MRQVVDHQKRAQLGRTGVEGAALVDLGHALHEADQLRGIIQHEGVDGDAAPGHAPNGLEGLGYRVGRDAAETHRPLDPQLLHRGLHALAEARVGSAEVADGAGDIVTEKQYEAFEFALEYKISKGGNSGVYLRGQIEIQVLDSFGKTKTLRIKVSKSVRKALRRTRKLKVRATDVAEAALFFASERSSRTTGACLTIDGGVKDAFPR